MNAPHTDARVEAYLAEVRRTVAAVDPAQADDISAEIAEHLQDAAADAEGRGEPFDVESAISELGDPAVIAAAVEPSEYAVEADAPPVGGIVAGPDSQGRPEPANGAVARLLASPLVVAVTLTCYLMGVLWSPVVVVIALVLVWSSPRWRVGDKLVATIFNPFVLLFGLPLLQLGIPIGWSLAVVAPVFVTVYLVLRIRRLDGGRVMRVPRADAGRMPRGGSLAQLDRPLAAAIATAAAPFALVVVVVPALVAGDWAALPVTVPLSVVLLTTGVAVLVASNGWSLVERTIGVVAFALVAGATTLVVQGAIADASTFKLCSAGSCEVLPPDLRDPAALLDQIARWVLPLVLFAAGWVAARFVPVAGGVVDDAAPRSAGSGSRRLPLVVAVCSLLGAAGGPGVIAMSGGSLLGGVVAIVGLSAWLTAAVIVLRSPRWSSADRCLATLLLPVITWFTLYFLVAGPDAMMTLSLRYADLPYVPPFPAAEVVPGVAVVAGVAQFAIAVRLLVAAGSTRSRITAQAS